MAIEHYIAQYQKKIGTHDKQQWERTIEQRIFHGLNNIQLRSAKPKTELIDLDLVRGSSFTKAKPTHGFVTVTKLATLRVLFLPLYSKWWATQTSGKIFAVLLLTYLAQLINLAIYSLNIPPLDAESTESQLSTTEIIVPMLMMWILSFIHSQIVSTNPGPENPVRPSVRQRKSYRRKRRYRKVVFQDDLKKGGQIGQSNSSTSKKIDVNLSVPVVISANSRHIDASKPQDDDGFESFNGNGSSHSENDDLTISENKTVIENPSNKDINVVPDSNVQTNSAATNSASDTDLKINLSAVRPSPTKQPQQPSKPSSPPTVPIMPPTITSRVPYYCAYSDGGASSQAYTKNWVKDHQQQHQHDTAFQPQQPSLQLYLRLYGNTKAASGGGSGGCSGLGGMLHRRLSAPELQFSGGEEVDSDSDGDGDRIGVKGRGIVKLMKKKTKRHLPQLVRRHTQYIHPPMTPISVDSTCDSDDDIDEDVMMENECETISSPETVGSCGPLCDDDDDDAADTPLLMNHDASTTSATEWIAGTTNSEDCCSYSSELDELDSQCGGPQCCDVDSVPTAILTSCVTPSDRVSCTIWERRDMKKAELSVLDISSAIIARVETMPEGRDYFYIGMVFATVLAIMPAICRICNATLQTMDTSDTHLSVFDLLTLIVTKWSTSVAGLLDASLGTTTWQRAFNLIALLERFFLGAFLFFLLTVAERTFKQRFLYAKLFSHLTSSRRARKSDLPHFRLNKVRNIKTWLSVRSYLKKRGPQRSVDVIVSAAFISTLLLLAFLCMELLKDIVALHSQYNIEALLWILGLGIMLLRFMTLGSKINKKYRNLSVLITEQINLYLQIELKPHKKDELMVANSVLKLAADLLKELESPFKISGLSANSYLYNITKVVILSALSGVLSEILGFKLKLHKIKIK